MSGNLILSAKHKYSSFNNLSSIYLNNTMSEDDLEKASFNVWFDSEVDFSDISLVCPIPYM